MHGNNQIHEPAEKTTGSTRRGALQRLDSWVGQAPWWLLSSALFVIALLKSGIALEVAAQQANPSFPYPEVGTVDGLSYGLPTIVWLLGIQGQTTTIGLVAFVLIVIGFLIAAYLVSRTFAGPSRALGLIALGLGPTITVLLGNIGRHDLLVVYGAVIVGLRGHKWWGLAVGTILMFLGNPEQTIVALGALTILSFAPAFRESLQRVATATLVALLALVLLQTWAASMGALGRSDWLGYHLRIGLLNFFGNGYLSLFAGYSILWVFVIWVIVKAPSRSRAIYSVALIAVPFTATVLTADQTRVFVGVSTAALFTVLRVHLADFTAALLRLTPNAVAWSAIAALFIPSIDITYRGFQRIPLQWVYDAFVNSGIIERIGVGPW